jgi:hypothetical protein
MQSCNDELFTALETARQYSILCVSVSQYFASVSVVQGAKDLIVEVKASNMSSIIYDIVIFV